MNWKGWLALFGTVALLVAYVVWDQVGDRADAAEWAAKDAERTAEVDGLIANAARAHTAAQNTIAEAKEQHASEVKSLRAELAEAKTRRKTRRKPKTLPECEDQLKEAKEELVLHERKDAIDFVNITSLEAALALEFERGDILELAVQKERENTEGWREYSRKQKRRHRVTMGFAVIGAAAAAGLAGYGAAQIP